ncbi:MAG: hypothetical protein WCL30_05380, partial [Pseudomonadota bacterium]
MTQAPSLDEIREKFDRDVEPLIQEFLLESIAATLGVVGTKNLEQYFEEYAKRLKSENSSVALDFIGINLENGGGKYFEEHYPTLHTLAKEVNQKIKDSGINKDISLYNQELDKTQAPKTEIAEAQAAPEIKPESTPLELEINKITKEQIKVPAGKLVTAIYNALESTPHYKYSKPYGDLGADLKKLYNGEFVAESVIKHFEQLKERDVMLDHEISKKIEQAITATKELEAVVEKSGIRELAAKAKAEQTPTKTLPDAPTAEV